MKKIYLLIFSLVISFLFINTIDASTANIRLSSSTSNVKVGDTFKVDVKTTSNKPIIKYEYTLNYDEDVVTLTNASAYYLYEGQSIKSSTKTFTFKALKKGQSFITVKSYATNTTNYKELDTSINGVNIKVGTSTSTTSAKVVKVMIDNEEYTVVNDKSVIKKLLPEGYEKITIKINNEDVTAYKNPITNYILIALKEKNNNTNLYIYDEENNSYKLYKDYKFDYITLIILEPKKDSIPNGYKKTTTKINNEDTTAYKKKKDSNYSLLYGMNIKTGKAAWYMHESTENTLQLFDTPIVKEKVKEDKKLDKKDYLIIGLSAFILILLIIDIVALSKKKHK